MNALDIIMIGIISLFAFISYKKGFILSCFSFLPMLLALAGAYFVHPMAAKMLRMTPLYDSLQTGILNSLDLEGLIGEKTMNAQAELIQNMNLPDFLKSSLIENNNPVIYEILNVEKIQDYIAGFIANMCINILSMAIVFFAVFICAKIVLGAMNFFAKLPVLSAVNKIAGFGVGIIQGLFVIWLVGIALTFFYTNPQFEPVFVYIEKTKITKMLYENNMLLFMILKIFV